MALPALPLMPSTSPPATLLRLQRAPRGERGVSIVLAMLVLFVLLVVVYQVVQLSFLESDKARYRVDTVRFRYLADACVQQAVSSLLMDLEEAAESQEQSQSGALGGLGAGADENLEASAAAVTGSTDSLLDEWKSPAGLAPPMGEGLEVYVEVVDEDSKINLLGLWTADEEKRKEWRGVFVELLDKAFEGTSLDLSSIDAEDVLDDLDEWVKGRRGTFEQLPLPPLKLSDAEEEAARKLDTDIIEDEEKHLPLTLAELGMIEGLQPEHLTGFVEDGEFHPGLEELVTVWSHLELKAEPEEEDPFSGSPFQGGGSVFGAGSDADEEEDGTDADEEDEEPEDLDASPTNDGRVNVNLAPLAVLRALAPDDIPTAFLEKVVEFRERVRDVRGELDERARSGLQDQASIFDPAPQQDEQDLDDEEEDPTRFVFRSEQEVFDKVEEEMELSVFTDDEDKALFLSRLGVTSQVFTIKVLVRDPERGRRSSFRAVVWRMETPDGPRAVVLQPLTEFHDARRLKDFPEDLSDISEGRFDLPPR